jgi:hypothetical protein
MADDVVVQAQSTLFARQGLTTQTKAYSLPLSLAGSIAYAYLYSGVLADVWTAEQLALKALLLQDSKIIPGGQTLYNIQSLNPLAFPGAGDLANIYQKDPFSTDYETSTSDLFDRVFATARAAAQTGPVNVRGGTARQAFEFAELSTQISINRFKEIWQNQLALASVVEQAVQIANAVINQIREEQLKAQQLQAGTEQGLVMQTLSAAEQAAKDKEVHIRSLAGASEFLGVPIMRTQEALEGQGAQAPVTTGFGMSYWR